MSLVGKGLARLDGPDKVTGRAMFVDDLLFPGMLHARAVRSPHAHARIVKVDASKALKIPRVRAVVTAKDVPGTNRVPLLEPKYWDMPFLAEQEVNFVGEAVALVAAETAAAAAEAMAVVKVEYEPLPAVLTLDDAIRLGVEQQSEGRIFQHWAIHRGDVGTAMRDAAVVVEGVYRTPYQEHAYLEMNGMLAVPGPGGLMTVYASTQCPYYNRHAVAVCLGMPLTQVHVIGMPSGGGFGGKEDMPSLLAGQAALLASKTGRPVKLCLTREEDMISMSKRHPALIRCRTAAGRDGTLLAMEIDFYLDGGAYTTLSPIVAWRGTIHAPGPYACPNVRVDTWALKTNKITCGAYRGFGTLQAITATESQMDQLAAKLRMDPAELRRRNLLEDGGELATGQKLVESVGAKPVLDAALERSGYAKKKAEYAKDRGPIKRGIGVSCLYYGTNLGARGNPLEKAYSQVTVAQDGSVELAVGTVEIGQGMNTILAQMAAEELGVPADRVRLSQMDTSRLEDCGPTVASRTTVMSGNAVIDACRKLRRRMDAVAAALPPGSDFDQVAMACWAGHVPMSETGFWSLVMPTGAAGTPDHPDLVAGDAYCVYSWAANVIEVAVDTETGEVTCIGATCAVDAGRVINRQSAEGQIEGGLTQGLGFALMEEHRLREGRVLNPKLSSYIIPSIGDVPVITPVLVEVPYSRGPYGAKSLGELPVMGIGGAVINAVASAIGVRLAELPATPERVLDALDASRVA